MIPMVINDLCWLRQEDGYINGFLEANGYEIEESIYETLYHSLLKKAIKYDKWGEAREMMSLDDLKSIDIFLNYMISYLRYIDETEFKKQLLRRLRKINIENGIQRAQWEHENYEYTIVYYKTMMRYIENYELQHLLPEKAKINDEEKELIEYLNMEDLDIKADIVYDTIVDYLEEQILR